jgi:hypothetical protein
MKQEELFNYTKLTDEQLKTYAVQGYLIIKGIIKPEGVKQMQEECMVAWN